MKEKTLLKKIEKLRNEIYELAKNGITQDTINKSQELDNFLNKYYQLIK